LAREALYILGLVAIGTALNGAGLGLSDYARSAALALSGYVAATSVLVWQLARRPGFELKAGGRTDWFPRAQGLVAGLAAALSLWMALDGSHDFAARLAGPLVAALLTSGFVLLAEWRARSEVGAMVGISPILRHVALALGTLTAIEIGFA